MPVKGVARYQAQRDTWRMAGMARVSNQVVGVVETPEPSPHDSAKTAQIQKSQRFSLNLPSLFLAKTWAVENPVPNH